MNLGIHTAHNKMKTNETENIVAKINVNVFFSEFTFSKNDFKELKSNQKLEFADNVVWLDDIFFVYQIKDRDNSNGDDIKWFDNKILKLGVKQIKNTLKYLNDYPEILIKNEKGHVIDISKAKNTEPRKLIIYTPSESLPESKRQLKFYESSQNGLIHLFHSEDYYWVCKYLLTPAEVEEYLEFRESFYTQQGKILNLFPEQYILGHFLETLDTNEIVPKYIENLKIIDKEAIDFDISFLIQNFTNHIKLTNQETDYYPVIKEIAKLNRSEMSEFKKRFVRSLEMCKKNEFILPYTLYTPRTDCGFAFIPLAEEKKSFWKIALNNLTLAQKYVHKARKCVGVIIFEKGDEFEIYWEYADYPWSFDSEIEKRLKENYPFRKTRLQKIDNRYKN